jgi:hypothetical protein
MTKQELKDSIALVVNTNGNGGITGANLQEKLFELVDRLKDEGQDVDLDDELLHLKKKKEKKGKEKKTKESKPENKTEIFIYKKWFYTEANSEFFEWNIFERKLEENKEEKNKSILHGIYKVLPYVSHLMSLLCENRMMTEKEMNTYIASFDKTFIKSS